MSQGMPRAAACTAAGLIIAALLLAGCSGGSGSATGAASASRAGTGRAFAGAQEAGRSGRAGPVPGGPARLSAARPDIVDTASMTVRVADLGRAAGRAAKIARDSGGYVSQQNIALHRAKPGSAMASIQLKIPAATYPAALTELAAIGTQTSLRQQAQDVTQQVADTASRVASDKAAITQLRALLARAGSVASLLTVQDQINSQESALEAMLAQQRALNHETAYATVSLRLLPPATGLQAGQHAKPRAGGFVGGLTAGWRALVTVVSWLLRALGAVLPIGLACALIGYLGYRSLRGRRWDRRRGARPAPGDGS
jgi:hypothetical protein